ncbi:hypothetical protein TA3x_001096 [Tundrisphaera sp. TA3]|uniref:hypothetical protein n=1 Tax=Tundrisphaera sp. TA3 TaxID=3435775 RepID=UPI003EB93D4A
MVEKNRNMLPGQTQPDFVDKLGDHLVSAAQNAPSTGSVFWAAWRTGLKDLQNFFANPMTGVTAGHDDPASIGNVVSREVYDEKHPRVDSNALEASVKGMAVPETQSPLEATDVSEIGPPLATPMVKGQAVQKQAIDPLDQARESARETSKGQGKSRQIEVE